MLIELTVAGALIANDPIATVEGGGDKIELYEQRGEICPEGFKSARYYVNRASVVFGCYVIDGKDVLLYWADGDRGKAGIDRFTWVKGKRPATL